MLTSDNLQAWRVLSLTAQTGSLSETASRLGIELSKVSRLITSLEKEMGLTFFDKRRRPYRATPELKSLLNAVEPHLRAIDEACELSRARRERTVIRFSAPIELSRLYFSDVLLSYAESHPNVTFSLVPEQTVEGVLAGTVDAAVLNQPPGYAPDLTVRLYHITSTAVLATPEYLRRNGTPRSPADLVQHTGLLLKTVNLLPTHCLYRDGSPSGMLRWKSVFLSHDQIALKELLLEHRGLTVDLSLGHVIDELWSGRIVSVLPGWERAPWYMCLVTRRDRESQLPELRRFAEFIAKKTGDDWRTVTEAGRQAILRQTGFLLPNGL